MQNVEDDIAVTRLWDPIQVFAPASMMLLSRKVSEQVAFHPVTGGYISRHLARTTRRGRDAPVFHVGA